MTAEDVQPVREPAALHEALAGLAQLRCLDGALDAAARAVRDASRAVERHHPDIAVDLHISPDRGGPPRAALVLRRRRPAPVTPAVPRQPTAAAPTAPRPRGTDAQGTDPRGTGPQGADALDRLTRREREVLALLAQGRSNTGIAEALVLSDSAVAKHINAIFTKLDIPPADADNRRVLAAIRFLRSRDTPA